MMGKKLRNLALLGGLGAAAYMMGSKKDDSKDDSKSESKVEEGRTASGLPREARGVGPDKKKADAVKPRIVTKERDAREKSGFTNLRDCPKR
jgi:hypothetical protein